MGKEYLFGELEKLIADKIYYEKTPEKRKELIVKTETILTKLKEYDFDKVEKKQFFKVMAILKKLKEFIK